MQKNRLIMVSKYKIDVGMLKLQGGPGSTRWFFFDLNAMNPYSLQKTICFACRIYPLNPKAGEILECPHFQG